MKVRDARAGLKRRRNILSLLSKPRPATRPIHLISTVARPLAVESEMREAIAFHLDGMARNGEPIPEPHTHSAYVEIPAQAQ
jgi:hypothetical protein